jgi:hypothetical protein
VIADVDPVEDEADQIEAVELLTSSIRCSNSRRLIRRSSCTRVPD